MTVRDAARPRGPLGQDDHCLAVGPRRCRGVWRKVHFYRLGSLTILAMFTGAVATLLGLVALKSKIPPRTGRPRRFRESLLSFSNSL